MPFSRGLSVVQHRRFIDNIDIYKQVNFLFTSTIKIILSYSSIIETSEEKQTNGGHYQRPKRNKSKMKVSYLRHLFILI